MHIAQIRSTITTMGSAQMKGDYATPHAVLKELILEPELQNHPADLLEALVMLAYSTLDPAEARSYTTRARAIAVSLDPSAAPDPHHIRELLDQLSRLESHLDPDSHPR